VAEKINVFVYGTLRTGQGNYNRLLKDVDGVEKVCDDKISGFIMFHLGGFPAIVPVDLVYKESHAREIQNDCDIIGEVFSVTPDVLKRLDRLEGYYPNRKNNFYSRGEIITENGHKTLVYFMDRVSYGVTEIESGDWLS